MLTVDEIRACALALPEAYEAPHFDIISFRVGKGKIFCTIHTKAPRIVLKLDPEDLHNLADGEAVVGVEGKSGALGWTYVYYERLEPGRLPGLMRMAWATVAPKKLVAANPF